MERTKLAYLILKDHIRISNLKLIKADLFTLNDNFEKLGSYGNQEKGLSKYYSEYIDKNNESLLEEKKHYIKINKINQEKIEENTKKMKKSGIEGRTELIKENRQLQEEIDANKTKIFMCPEKLEGGLYGTTLNKAWPTLLFFLTDFKVLRSYLG